MTGADIKDRLRAEATRLGFSLFGVAPATPADGFDRFAAWLDAGYAGDMGYLHDRREARRSPTSILNSVRSVVMLGLEYGPAADVPAGVGRVAAYAHGPDYHPFLWAKVNALDAFLEGLTPDAVSRGVADSAPLLERDFARRAGLGWFGKNTMLINTRRGSFFLLAGLLTNLDLPPDESQTGSHCGTCTKCLDACPTGAFPAAGTLDARKCISYLTIEAKAPIPLGLRPAVGDWLFGCDVCQDVCPWNRRAGERSTPFPTDPELTALDPVEVINMTDAEFRRRFKGTSLFRAKWVGLRRNAAVVLGNVGDARALPALAVAAADADAVVREAAAWAIEQIRRRATTGTTGSPDR